MRQDPLPGAPIEQLIERARSGDQHALGELFRYCQPLLDEWASRRLERKQPSSMRPSDIAQETAKRAFERFSTFHGSTEGEWRAWLLRILQTCATRSFRDAARKKRDDRGAVSLDSPEAFDVPAAQPSPSQCTAREEQWRQTFAQIFALPEDQREAIWLCQLKERPVAEVARLMGKSEGAVAGLVQRGLKALRQRMAPGEEGPPSDASLPNGTQDASAALLVYLRRRDAGDPVDPVSFVSEHPSCAEELHHMLAWIERIQAIRPLGLED